MDDDDVPQEFSVHVQKLWEEKYGNPVVQEEQEDAEEEQSEDTVTTSTECCGRECGKV